MFHAAKFSPVAALLFLAALFTNTAVSQTVSIRLNGNQTRLEAASPLNVGCRVQASTDHENWEDISDQASGALSYSIDSSEDHKRFFRLRTWPTEDAPITVLIIGDSTVADFESKLAKILRLGARDLRIFEAECASGEPERPVSEQQNFPDLDPEG